jgi:diadenosine tetraphosphate (Ap4A) HIT family hydrolase/8-oxo-dGTP pyrophosphatase MutT (NUDIX family)
MAEYVTPACALCLHDALEPQFVFETADVLLLAASQPLTDGHLLVVPRQHAPSMASYPPGVQAQARRLKERALGLLREMNGGAVVFEYADLDDASRHACWHIVPRLHALPEVLPAGRRREDARDLVRLRELAHEWRAFLYWEQAHAAHLLQARPGEGEAVLDQLAQALSGSPPTRHGGAAAHWLRERWQRRMAEAGEPVQVVTCVLRRDGRVCLLRRSPLVDSAPGLWHGVSGYLPEGVDPLEQALREIEQELGLLPTQVELVRVVEPQTFGSALMGRLWRIHPFLFEVKDGEPRLNWEHTELAWVHPWEVDAYDTIRSFPVLVRLLFQHA